MELDNCLGNAWTKYVPKSHERGSPALLQSVHDADGSQLEGGRRQCGSADEGLHQLHSNAGESLGQRIDPNDLADVIRPGAFRQRRVNPRHIQLHSPPVQCRSGEKIKPVSRNVQSRAELFKIIRKGGARAQQDLELQDLAPSTAPLCLRSRCDPTGGGLDPCVPCCHGRFPPLAGVQLTPRIFVENIKFKGTTPKRQPPLLAEGSGRTNAFANRSSAGVLLCYNLCMTFMEATFELQSPLTEQQMRQLGAFANTYGLRRFRVDETKKLLTFEYDASRLTESQVGYALGQLRIRVLRRVDPFAAAGVPA
jgi:hypothetical protein